MASTFKDVWQPAVTQVPRDRSAGWIDNRENGREIRVRKTNGPVVWALGQLDQPVMLDKGRQLRLDRDAQLAIKAWAGHLGAVEPSRGPNATEKDVLYDWVRVNRTRNVLPVSKQLHSLPPQPWSFMGVEEGGSMSWLNQMAKGAQVTDSWTRARQQLLRKLQSKTASDQMIVSWVLESLGYRQGWAKIVASVDLVAKLVDDLRTQWWPQGPPDYDAMMVWVALQTQALAPGRHDLALILQKVVDNYWCWSARGNQTPNSRQQFKAVEEQLLMRVVCAGWDTDQPLTTYLLAALPVHSDRWIALATLPNAVNSRGNLLWSEHMTRVLAWTGCRAWHDPIGRAQHADKAQTGSLTWLDFYRPSASIVRAMAQLAKGTRTPTHTALLKRLLVK